MQKKATGEIPWLILSKNDNAGFGAEAPIRAQGPKAPQYSPPPKGEVPPNGGGGGGLHQKTDFIDKLKRRKHIFRRF